MEALTLVARSLASMTMFAVRPFLAAFCLAAAARLGAAAVAGQLPAWLPAWLLQGLAVLNLAPASLLIADLVLVLLALLALFEFIALENDELQPYYEQTAAVTRTGTAFIVTFGLVDAQMTSVLRTLILQVPDLSGGGLLSATSPFGFAQTVDWLPAAAFGLTLLIALLTAFGSWAIGAVRSAVSRLLAEFDSEDSFGLRGLLNTLDTLTGLIGALLFWYLPLVGLVLAGLTLAVLALLSRWLERHAAQPTVPCVQCAAALPLSAPFCAACAAAQPAPRQVGLFGRPAAAVMRDPLAQQFALISVRRCPRCAARLPERRVQQDCTACTQTTFADQGAVQRYLAQLDRRVLLTLIGCLLCGLVPLFGLVPGLVLYRLSLIAPLSAYVSAGAGCLTRWALHLLNGLLILLQPLPVVGVVTLPLLALSNYLVYRNVLLRSAGSASLGQ